MSARKYQEVQDMQPEPVRFVAEADDMPSWADAAKFYASAIAGVIGWAFVAYIFWRFV